MSFEFHKNKERYFNIQYENSRTSVLPFIQQQKEINADTKVLEIGCAEAGVLKAFTDLGAQCTGIELAEHRVELAKQFLKTEFESGQIDFLAKDIYDIDIDKDLKWKYDVVILKDVIEHIHNQEKFISRLGDFLAPGGIVFFGFPPWTMPFGGHQQVAKNKLLSKLPYYHLLPISLYKSVLKIFGETDQKIENLLDIKETQISTKRFEHITRQNGFEITDTKFFLISPIYSFKFGLQTREQFPFISAIPIFRDFLTSAVFYTIKSA